MIKYLHMGLLLPIIFPSPYYIKAAVWSGLDSPVSNAGTGIKMNGNVHSNGPWCSPRGPFLNTANNPQPLVTM